jgi:uncharacterized membrane protein YesL
MFERKAGNPGGRQTIFEAPFWKFFSQLGDFFILSVFWLLTSLPVVTIGTSTTALFFVVLKSRNGEAGMLWKMYKKSYLQNLKQSVGIWLFYIFIVIDACIIGYMLLSHGTIAWQDISWGGKYNLPLIIAALIYISMTIYTAALLAFFKQTNRQCILAAFCLTFNRIFSTLYFMIVIAALFYLTLYIFPPLIFVDVPLAVYLISIRINRIFQKQILRAQARSGQEESSPPVVE